MSDQHAPMTAAATEQILKSTCTGCVKLPRPSNADQVCPECGGIVFAEPDSFRPGLLLDGKYEIGEQLGLGSWGTVYSAKQIGVDRRVALKVLHRHLVGRRGKIDRFWLEAKALTELAHEAVVAIYDVGTTEADGVPYIAEEYVEGQSFRDIIKSGEPIEPAQFKFIFGKILEVLEQAHRKGIVHRDIKPSNIMICHQENRSTLKLLDFGIAKLTTTETPSPLTGTGEVLGTPLYMSPEQCICETIDGRSDLYALGCIMYEVLAGENPFAAESSFQCMMKQVQHVPPNLRDVGVMPEYADMVAKAIEKDPKNRFQTAAQFRDTLLNLPDQCRDTSHQRTRKPIPTNFGHVAWYSALLLVLVGGMALWPLLLKRAQVMPIQTSARQISLLENEKNVSKERSLEPSSLELITKSSPEWELIRTLFPLTTMPSHLYELIRDVRQRSMFGISDTFELCEVRPKSQTPTKVTLEPNFPQQWTGLAFDESGNNIYAASANLYRWDLGANKWIKLGTMPEGGSGFTYSPTHKAFFAFSRGDRSAGHLSHLVKFDEQGSSTQLPLNKTIPTWDDGARAVQIRPQGQFLYALVPQQKLNEFLMVKIDPDKGQILAASRLED